MSGYSQGRNVEYAVVHDLGEHGYVCVRAASSKGIADVVAIKDGRVLLVNVKRTTMPGPAERLALYALTVGYPYLVALVARKPLRQSLTYVKLFGPGPGEWWAWAPCGLGEEPSQDADESSARQRDSNDHEHNGAHVADGASHVA